MKAVWHDTIIAEADLDKIVPLEGHYYFPPEAVKREFLKKSGQTYVCHWKGQADYYDIVIGDKINKGAAWVYENPSSLAESIKGRFAFWKGVEIIEE